MYKYNSGLLPTTFFIICLNLINMFLVTIQDNLHIYIATLELRLRSARIKGAIIWNYFNTRLMFTSYSILNYKCILMQFILHNDVNI